MTVLRLQGWTFPTSAEPDHQPLGLILGMTEDVDGNIWAVCSGSFPKAGTHTRFSRCANSSLRRKFRLGRIASGPTRRNLDWPSHGDVLFRKGVEKEFRDGFRCQSAHQSPACRPERTAPSSPPSTTGSSDCEGKAQRMTTKNGLPCNLVYLFRSGQAEALVAVYRVRHRRASRFRATAVVGEPGCRRAEQGSTTPSMERGREHRISSADVSTRWSGVVFERSRRTDGGSVQDPANRRYRRQTYVESVIVDRKEFGGYRQPRGWPPRRDLQIDYTSPTFSIPQRGYVSLQARWLRPRLA